MRTLTLVSWLALAACQRDPPPTAAAPVGEARIVSLSPSATEVVAALGAADRLVGVDSYSAYPSAVKALPKTGDYLHPDLEAIARLRPTLVIADDVHAQAVGALRDVGINATICAIHTLPDVQACLRQVGDELGRHDDAVRASAQIDDALAAARHPAAAPRTRVLAVLDRNSDDLGNVIAAAPGSYVDELLAVVGAQNVIPAGGSPYPKLSLEDLQHAQPAVILDLSFAGHSGIAAWASLDVPAVRDHRVVAVGDDVLLAPSPRVQLALAKLAHALAAPGPSGP